MLPEEAAWITHSLSKPVLILQSGWKSANFVCRLATHFSGSTYFRHFTAEISLKFCCVYVLLPLFFSGKPQFYDFTAEILLEFTIPTSTFSAANPSFDTLPLKSQATSWPYLWENHISVYKLQIISSHYRNPAVVEWKSKAWVKQPASRKMR